MDHRSWRRPATPLRTIVVAGLVCSFAIGASAADKKKKDPARKAIDLVWPMPPEKPRLRFVAEIHGAGDIEPRRQSGVFARMAGLRDTSVLPSFQKPHGIATDSQHRIYVSDSALRAVFVLDQEKKVSGFLGMDSGVAFRLPLGLTVDAKDRIWVADGGAQRVLAFDAQHQLRALIGKPGEMENPTAVAVDAERNRLYVTDSKKHCVVVYDTETGLLVTQFGEFGPQSGNFRFPTNLTVDKAGRIYVSDALNSRVQIFGPDLKFLESFGGAGDTYGKFVRPKGIALDSYGNIYVVDSQMDNFQIFDQKKRVLMFLGGLGKRPGEFSIPHAISIDDHNLIYVSDQFNARIQIFQLLDGATDVESTSAAAVPQERR